MRRIAALIAAITDAAAGRRGAGPGGRRHGAKALTAPRWGYGPLVTPKDPGCRCRHEDELLKAGAALEGGSGCFQETDVMPKHGAALDKERGRAERQCLFNAVVMAALLRDVAVVLPPASPVAYPLNERWPHDYTPPYGDRERFENVTGCALHWHGPFAIATLQCVQRVLRAVPVAARRWRAVIAAAPGPALWDAGYVCFRGRGAAAWTPSLRACRAAADALQPNAVAAAAAQRVLRARDPGRHMDTITSLMMSVVSMTLMMSVMS
eukprot:gene45534-17634_t